MKKSEFLNRSAGALPLASAIFIAYIYAKYQLVGTIDLFGFAWGSIWFFGILFQALASDLFTEEDTWIYNTLKKIEGQNISAKEKMEKIRYHLDVAVKKYMNVFLQVNGLSKFNKIKKYALKVAKGKITVKELLIIGLYALYDLVWKSGTISITEPWDIVFTFGIVIILKIIDANKGFAGILATMWKEAYNAEKSDEHQLTLITEYIQQLGAIFNMTIDEAKPEEIKALTKPEG